MLRLNERLIIDNATSNKNIDNDNIDHTATNKSRNHSAQSKENHSTTSETHYVPKRNAKSKSSGFAYNKPKTNLDTLSFKVILTENDNGNNNDDDNSNGNYRIQKLSLTPQLNNYKTQKGIARCESVESSSIIMKKEGYKTKRLHRKATANNGVIDSINALLARNDIRSAFISKLIQCEIWLPFNQRPHYNSLIIFDWDDTLFPTSNLLNRKDFNEDLTGNERLSRKIKKLQINVLSILTSSLNRGHTFIITNAVRGWVESNTKRFFPSVMPLFSQIKVISAREEFERFHPCNPRMWKIKSFLNILRNFDSHRVTNILCIGDSEYEMDAGKKMASYFKHVCIKRIRFKNNPSFHEVTNQIYSVINQFTFIHSSVKSGVYHAHIKEKVKRQHSKKSSRKSFH